MGLPGLQPGSLQIWVLLKVWLFQGPPDNSLPLTSFHHIRPGAKKANQFEFNFTELTPIGYQMVRSPDLPIYGKERFLLMWRKLVWKIDICALINVHLSFKCCKMVLLAQGGKVPSGRVGGPIDLPNINMSLTFGFLSYFYIHFYTKCSFLKFEK